MDEEIRIKCLELASNQYHNHVEIIIAAQKYYDFITGTNDAEVLSAVRALVKKVKC